MRRGTIRFERSSAQLDRASYPTLQRLAAVAAGCANVRIEIAGHTDNDGGLERNQELSEQRAQSVADFLARAGVAQQHMHTIGYGETHPMVPNTSARNKARNRRIEFNVKLD
jgi:OOP family OmpA-OmpF porin